MNKLCWLISTGCFLMAALPAWAAPAIPETSVPEAIAPEQPQISSPTPTAVAEASPEQLTVFPVGINVNKRTVVESVLIRGKEDGERAINFENWLLPYDAVIKALKFTTKVLPDGQIELRSPLLVTRINPNSLRTDPELGAVFSVKDLQTLFNVKAEFDINEYVIQLQVSGLNLTSSEDRGQEAPVTIEGLPRLKAPGANLTAIQQQVNISRSNNTSTISRGDFTAVGSFLGGSVFTRLNQPDLHNLKKWQIREARFERQTDKADYIIGTQSPFWPSNATSGDYLGFTTIVRQGFQPPQQLSGESDLRQRMQAASFGRTISGRADPGTLVRLTQGFSDRVIGEVLVDSSGIYRFDNVQFGSQNIGGFYRVLLYPQGRLTTQPEIREATFSTVPGQLPAGASALAISSGLQRKFSSSDRSELLGNFTEFQGGIAQRWGLSNSLTVGLGGVYDQSLKGLGEVFFKPENFPLEAAVSVLSGGGGSNWIVNSNIRFDPSPNFHTRFSSDRLSSRFNVDWQIWRGFTLLGILDSKDAPAAGVQFNLSGKNNFTFVRATLDTKNRLRWSLFESLKQLELTASGNEIGTQSQLVYHLSRSQYSNTGLYLSANYETRQENRNDDNLVSLGAGYRSPGRDFAGDYSFEAQLGYGIGSQGSGIVASVGTSLIPGLMLRARYQGISLTSDEPSFNLELVPTLNLQRGFTGGDRRLNYLLTQGGVLIQAFFDRNNNGKHDPGEKFYSDPNLILLNNQPIQSLRPEIRKNRILLFLPPGTYRLDLDAAGFPPDTQPVVDAYAVKVAAGSYTPVLVPLITSFTRSGVVSDTHGKPISGARVEAVSPSSGQRLFSVTNDAGVYYLERLQPGSYNLLVNGKPAQLGTITLDKSAQPFQELNLKQP